MFFIKNSIITTLFYVRIINCKSNISAPGLIMLTDTAYLTIGNPHISNISKSSFHNNHLVAGPKTKYHGLSLYFNSKNLIVTIEDCYFVNNTIRMNPSDRLAYGGPCINSLNTYIMAIIHSFFWLK